jgi:UDP-N-acetyl-D-glucosamine dehydrogenase
MLNDRGQAVRGARIALLGVSYKPGVGDVRESPALKLIELLRGLGADVVYHDALVPSLEGPGLASLPLDEALGGADCAVIVTAQPGVDHDAAASAVPCLLDLRGVTRPAANVVRL